MPQPRIELGAQQASVAQGWKHKHDVGMLDFATKPLVRALVMCKNINTYILGAFSVVYYEYYE